MKRLLHIVIIISAMLLFVACPAEENNDSSDDTDTQEECAYNGSSYLIGDTFDALDGCNSCTCNEDLSISCTLMECTPEACTGFGQEYFEPGCDDDDSMSAIEPGCYFPCEGDICSGTVCQAVSINPCVCEEGQDCCEACGATQWLCLDAPDSCVAADPAFMIVSAQKTFGECQGECRFNLSFAIGESGDCARASLEVCGWGEEGCTRTNTGTLTALGQAYLSGSVVEIKDDILVDTYGCPDCADGGASAVTFVMDSTERTISYEYGNPPNNLVHINMLTMALMNALDDCLSNDYITIPNDACTL
ncbi:MAG: hypothetical protein JXX29_01045 [Deltaproteobacteria bacterium]|nr:hypothetical protein [Deltaproteobacteria bacterium]MBN2670224.1 hypothetical protein [Deltaproteobacteria bacterium]